MWWPDTAWESRYSGGSATVDSSAPRSAREMIGGRLTVDRGGTGTVAVGVVVGAVPGTAGAVVVSVGAGAVVVAARRR